jgi:hypothetical protein
MQLKIVYSNNCIDLFEKVQSLDVQLEAYNIDIYSDRKKAFKIKGGYGAIQNPFAVLIDEKPIKAFYNEDKSCTFENIKNYLDEYSRTKIEDDKES